MKLLDRIPLKASHSSLILRIGLAAVFFSHGATRAWMDRVAPFGEWLDGLGFPVGIAWAWGVTIFEMAGSLLLLANHWVRLVSLLFIVQMLVGIALVHWPHGWFVVGHGQNGMEFSILLIAALLAVFGLDRQDVPVRGGQRI